MEKYELGYNKKSFSLQYHDGEIWCEHLDSLEDKKELVIQKFKDDLIQISKPAISSFIAVNLDETVVDDEIINLIVTSFVNMSKPICKVVFVGLNRKYRKYIKKLNNDTAFIMECMDDYEKAKEWLF